MKTSKELFRDHIQQLLDAGSTYDDIAREFGIKSGNLIDIIRNPANKAVRSLERLPALARLYGLTPLQVTQADEDQRRENHAIAEHPLHSHFLYRRATKHGQARYFVCSRKCRWFLSATPVYSGVAPGFICKTLASALAC